MVAVIVVVGLILVTVQVQCHPTKPYIIYVCVLLAISHINDAPSLQTSLAHNPRSTLNSIRRHVNDGYIVHKTCFTIHPIMAQVQHHREIHIAHNPSSSLHMILCTCWAYEATADLIKLNVQGKCRRNYYGRVYGRLFRYIEYTYQGMSKVSIYRLWAIFARAFNPILTGVCIYVV